MAFREKNGSFQAPSPERKRGVWRIFRPIAEKMRKIDNYQPSRRLIYPGEYPELQKEVAKLSAKAGMEMPVILVDDRKVDNAFATRYGGRAAIGFTQGFLESAPKEGMRHDIAHELGHAKAKDYITRMVMRAVSNTIGVLGGSALFAKIIAGSYAIGGYAQALKDVPLAGACLASVMFIAAAAENVVSRWREREADRFSARLVGDADGAKERLIALYSRNNLAKNFPNPLYTYLNRYLFNGAVFRAVRLFSPESCWKKIDAAWMKLDGIIFRHTMAGMQGNELKSFIKRETLRMIAEMTGPVYFFCLSTHPSLKRRLQIIDKEAKKKWQTGFRRKKPQIKA